MSRCGDLVAGQAFTVRAPCLCAPAHQRRLCAQAHATGRQPPQSGLSVRFVVRAAQTTVESTRAALRSAGEWSSPSRAASMTTVVPVPAGFPGRRPYLIFAQFADFSTLGCGLVRFRSPLDPRQVDVRMGLGESIQAVVCVLLRHGLSTAGSATAHRCGVGTCSRRRLCTRTQNGGDPRVESPPSLALRG